VSGRATQPSGRETSRARIAIDVLIPARSGAGVRRGLRPGDARRVGAGVGGVASGPTSCGAGWSDGRRRRRRRRRVRFRPAPSSIAPACPIRPGRGIRWRLPGGNAEAATAPPSDRCGRMSVRGRCVSGEEVVGLLTFAALPSHRRGGHLGVASCVISGREAGDAPDGPGHALVPETRNQERRPFDPAGPNHHDSTRFPPGRAICPTSPNVGARFDAPVTVV
jgi:hypothetical protein